MAELRIRTGQGWPVGAAMLAAQADGQVTQVFLDGEALGWIVPDSLFAYQREQIGELTAEVARLKAEIDMMEADHKTIHVTTAGVGEAIRDNTSEEPGTVLRETDGLHREWELGTDHIWRTR
jgi:hypothetical protein